MANPRNQKKIKRVLKYRQKGLSYREISRVTGYDFKTIHRVLRHYAIDPMKESMST